MKKIILGFIIVLSSLVMAEDTTVTNFKIKSKEKKPQATLDLTVRKINSKDLVAEINSTTQEIEVNIKDMGEVVVFETLDEFSKVTVEGKGNTFSKVLNINKDLNQGKEVRDGNYTYNLITFDGLRILKIGYAVYPEDLYVGILDNNKNVKNVYKLDLTENNEVATPTFIMNHPENMVFDVKTTINPKTRSIQDYKAETTVSFQTAGFDGIDRIDPVIEIIGTNENGEIILEDVEGSGTTIKVGQFSKVELKEEAGEKGKAYKITGIIRGADIAKLPGADTPEGIDMKFTGKLKIQIEIK